MCSSGLEQAEVCRKYSDRDVQTGGEVSRLTESRAIVDRAVFGSTETKMDEEPVKPGSVIVS